MQLKYHMIGTPIYKIKAAVDVFLELILTAYCIKKLEICRTTPHKDNSDTTVQFIAKIRQP